MANCATLDLDAETKEPVYIIAGSKGGVGKSMLALVVIDQLRMQGKQVLYFETDTSNADVWLCLERDSANAPGEAIDGVVMYTIKIDEEDGWIEMINIIDSHKDHVVVIGTASRTTNAVRSYGGILRDTMPALQRKLVTLWVIDEQRDSMNQLKDHLSVFPDTVTHVVKNSKHGADAFGLYDESKLRVTIESKGGVSLVMPRLALCVVTSLYSDRLAISEALDVLPLGNKYALLNFRNACRRVLEPVLA